VSQELTRLIANHILLRSLVIDHLIEMYECQVKGEMPPWPVKLAAHVGYKEED
jgi:hypothetical protein